MGGRVFITGMGGELGTRVAALLEADTSVDVVVGSGISPPRRRLSRATFHLVDPRNRIRLAALVHEVAPHVIVHLGVYEPHSRSAPPTALERTAAGSVTALGAAAETGALQRIVVRSGTEVYGRRRGSPLLPDESTPPQPTTEYGWSLLHVERTAEAVARDLDVPCTAVRHAPLLGPHVPSPLGRLLRLPAVPFHALADLPFSLVSLEDAARAVVAAVLRGPDGPVNVVGPGAVTAFQAIRMGNRIPVPVAGPGWLAARALAEVAGSPVPDHVVELLRRGRCADGSSTLSLLDVDPKDTTQGIVASLFDWAEVTYLDVIDGEAA